MVKKQLKLLEVATMTKTFANMIHLFACAALGKQVSCDITADISEIIRYAYEQNVAAMVFTAMKPLYEKGCPTIDKTYYQQLRYYTLETGSKNIRRNQFMSNVFCQLQENKIDYIVLKGETISCLYNTPSLRISSDTDILIKKQDLKKIKKILTSLNFNIKPKNPTSHHIVAVHPIGGILELHMLLYDELFDDVWFDKYTKQQEPVMYITVSDGIQLPTLGVTDGLIFITLHCIKHFLSRGVGIKQVMDTLMYMHGYKDKIDWDRFWQLMIHLNYNNFVNHLIGIGKEYLMFSADDLPKCKYDMNLINDILTDIEKGGVFGYEEAERSGMYMRYTAKRYSRFKTGSFSKYIRAWRMKIIVNALFPHIHHMAEKYEYLKKWPILYPIAWFKRITLVLWRIFKSPSNIFKYKSVFADKVENDVFNKRMTLFKQLDMI